MIPYLGTYCTRITGPGGWPRTVGHEFKLNHPGGMMLAPHSARRRDAQNERDGAGLRISVAAATPSAQRLRGVKRSGQRECSGPRKMNHMAEHHFFGGVQPPSG